MKLEAAFWLASYPKSGNTWVRLLLTAYHLRALDINANCNFTQHDANLYLHNVVCPVSLTELEPEEAIYLRHTVLMHLLAGTKFRPNIIKTHNANVMVGGVELIPQAMTHGAVYVVRDPRDVVTSFARHTGVAIDMAIANMNTAQNRLQNQGSAVASWLQTWSNHVKSWDKPGCVRVRYEDMLEDVEKEFRRILDGFKIIAEDDRVKTAIELCELEKLKKQEEEKGYFIEKGLADKFFGQGKGWKNELTENQVKKIEMDHGEVMESLGYKLEYL